VIVTPETGGERIAADIRALTPSSAPMNYALAHIDE